MVCHGYAAFKDQTPLPEVATADNGYSVSPVALDWVRCSRSYAYTSATDRHTYARAANTYASTTDAHAHASAANTYTSATD